MARIVLNTFGSFGDLHPFLAIAIELKRRGHTAVVATSEIYRTKIEAEEIAFAAVRPDVGQLLNDRILMERVWHPVRGTEYLLKNVILPYVEESFEDLDSASRGADLRNHAFRRIRRTNCGRKAEAGVAVGGPAADGIFLALRSSRARPYALATTSVPAREMAFCNGKRADPATTPTMG